MPDWQTVPADDFDYKTWLRYTNNYQDMMIDYDDGNCEECGYDFDELSDEEIETLYDFGSL